MVSYDVKSILINESYKLKGHQIIGELRLILVLFTEVFSLKGHQIIGELRLSY